MTIMLQKGQRIPLTKEDNSKLENFCVGANWGAINVNGRLEAVDLDLSVQLLDEDKNPLDAVYWNKLDTAGIHHSGDDREGDVDGDDGLDNEVISINLNQLDSKVNYITILLNSYNKIDFKDIPFASVRIYEGTPDVVKSEFAKFKIDNNSNFAGSMGMVLGALYKKDGAWKFNSIGQPVADHKLGALTQTAIRLL